MATTLFNDSLDEEDSLVPHLPVSEFLPELPTSEPTAPTALKLNESFLDNSLSELDTQLPFGFEEEFKQNTKDGQDTTLGENMNDSLCENGESNSYELKTPPLQQEKLTGNSGNSSSTPSHSAGSINRGSPSILIKRTPSIPIRRTPLKVSSPSQKPDAPKLKPSFGKKKISIKVDKGNETASIPLLEANTPGVDSAAKTNSTATSDISDNGSASGNGTKKAKAANKKKLKKSKVGSSGGGTNEDTSSCKVNIQKTTTKKILSSEEKEARKVKCEQAKSEREAKKKENEEKKTEREQKKVENEKLKEQKRLDAEQKNAEREQTKIENEKLKEQKAEQKKAEREQIKIDKELKKIETLKKKLAGKTSQLTIGEKSESSIKVKEKITAGENKENEDPSSQETINHQNETVKIAEKPGPLGEISLSPNLPPTSRVNNASIHQEEINSSDDRNKNSTTVNTDTLLYEKDQSSKIEKSIKRFEPPKMKDRESKPPKPKKKKPDLKKIGSEKPFESKRSSIKSKNLKRKRSLSDDSEDDSVQKPKRSKSVNYSGPVWVQCDNIGCQKWRKLVNCKDPSEVPEEWMCSRNTDPEYNRCSAPEEEWSDLKDSQEFVESMFVPGSIVWAKLEGYPWWPAMIEEDPDMETYYEKDDGKNKTPHKYHVVFIDTPVSRGWINSHNIQLLSDTDDANDDTRLAVAKKHKKSLQNSMRQAKVALKKTLKERLSQFGFSKRFYSAKKKDEASHREGSRRLMFNRRPAIKSKTITDLSTENEVDEVETNDDPLAAEE